MLYQYVAYTLADGVVRGKLEAATEAEVRAELEGQGLKPLNVKPPSKFNLSKFMPELDQVKGKELPTFARQASTMLASGATLLRVLEMLQVGGKQPSHAKGARANSRADKCRR